MLLGNYTLKTRKQSKQEVMKLNTQSQAALQGLQYFAELTKTLDVSHSTLKGMKHLSWENAQLYTQEREQKAYRWFPFEDEDSLSLCL